MSKFKHRNFFEEDKIRKKEKKKAKKNKHNNGKRKISKTLMYDERKQYKTMGEYDPTQNHLELFTQDVIDDLHEIRTCCSDNQLKARYVMKEIKDLGFRALGLGTNILTLYNPIYPGVVYKIALDDYGIEDNINDAWLSEVIPHYAKFITRDITGIVSVQERYVVVKSPERMATIQPDVLKLLNKLSKRFLIVDLGMKNFLNYGLQRDGSFVIIDGSDICPLPNPKAGPKCINILGMKKHSHGFKRCGGKLEYDETFDRMICKTCFRRYLPSEVKSRNQEVEEDMSMIMMDGLSESDRMQLKREAIAKIRERKSNTEIPAQPTQVRSKTVFVDPEEPEEDDTVAEVTEAVAVETFTAFIKSQAVPPAEEPEEDDDDENDAPKGFIQLKRVSNDTTVKPKDADIPDHLDVTSISEPDAPPKEPMIQYRIIQDTDDQVLDDGIYLDVTGDFEKAYDYYGLPVYITFDGKEYTKLITASMLKSLIDTRINELRDEGLL